jgi:hypothetical protein
LVIEKGTLAFSSRTALATGTTVALGNANSGSDDTVMEIPIASVGDQEVLNAAFTLGTLAEGSTSEATIRYVAAGTVGGAPRVNGTVDLNGRDLILENTSLTDNPTNSGLFNFAAAISGVGNVRIRNGTNPDGSQNGTPRSRLMNTANSWTGDLYIEILIKAHDIFERDGDDLHCTVPVGMTTASLGGAIEVPTLGSKADAASLAVTQSTEDKAVLAAIATDMAKLEARIAQPNMLVAPSSIAIDTTTARVASLTVGTTYMVYTSAPCFIEVGPDNVEAATTNTYLEPGMVFVWTPTADNTDDGIAAIGSVAGGKVYVQACQA